MSDPSVLSPSDTISHRTVTALSTPSGPGNGLPSGGSSSSTSAAPTGAGTTSGAIGDSHTLSWISASLASAFAVLAYEAAYVIF